MSAIDQVVMYLRCGDRAAVKAILKELNINETILTLSLTEQVGAVGALDSKILVKLFNRSLEPSEPKKPL